MKSKRFTIVMSGLAVALVMALSVPAQAVVPAIETWSNPPSVEGWTANPATQSNPGAGGNPGGYFDSVRNDVAFGNPSHIYWFTAAGYAGNWGTMFATTGLIAFDLRAFGNNTGDPTGPGIGLAEFVLYTVSGGFNSWTVSFGGINNNAGWVNETALFDANWTDAQATAAGWVEGGGAGTWANTVANVAEGYFDLTPSSGGAGGYFHAGLDNFSIPVPVVPEPGTVMLLGLGAGLLCWKARRRRS